MGEPKVAGGAFRLCSHEMERDERLQRVMALCAVPLASAEEALKSLLESDGYSILIALANGNRRGRLAGSQSSSRRAQLCVADSFCCASSLPVDSPTDECTLVLWAASGHADEFTLQLPEDLQQVLVVANGQVVEMAEASLGGPTLIWKW